MRAMRWAVVVAAVSVVVAVVAVAYAAGQVKAVPVQEVVRARQLQLVDAAGRVRAALVEGTGGPALTLVDEGGRPRVVLGLLGSQGGSPVLLMLGEKGQRSAELSLGKGSSQPQLRLFDERGTERASLSVVSGGEPSLMLSDEGGTPRVQAAVLSGGEPGLGLFDKDSKLVWSAP